MFVCVMRAGGGVGGVGGEDKCLMLILNLFISYFYLSSAVP